MKLGDIEFHIISDGSFWIDGGTVFGVVPKALWARLLTPDEQNRVRFGLNCLLVRAQGKNILLDTGIGTKSNTRRQRIFNMAAGKLTEQLAAHGLTPNDIHYVALSHLHFDHVGGCTLAGPMGKPVVAFPKAQHLVQRAAWEEAVHPSERNAAGYFPEDFMPIEEGRQLELLDGDTEMAPGVWLRVTHGHTAGHQVMVVNAGGHTVAAFADVMPTQHHLPLPWSQSFDVEPNVLLAKKKELLAQAEAERWLLVLDHGLDGERAGYVERTPEGRLKFKPISE